MKQQEIFELFVGTDFLRDWTHVPFTEGDYTYATDCYTLIRALTPNVEFSAEKCKEDINCAKLIPEEICNKVLDLREIDFEQYKTEDEWTDEDKECSECNGEGEVTWSYWANKKTYYAEFNCPVCDGKGYFDTNKKTGNKIFGNQYVRIVCEGVKTDFNIKFIERLQKVQKVLDCNITVLNYENNRIFCQIGIYQVLICGINGVDKVALTIEI